MTAQDLATAALPYVRRALKSSRPTVVESIGRAAWLVLWRLGRRTVRRIVTRETLWGGNVETWRGQFASRDSLFVWAFKTHFRRRRETPVVLAQPEYAHLNLVRVRTPRAASAWLSTLEAQNRVTEPNLEE